MRRLVTVVSMVVAMVPAGTAAHAQEAYGCEVPGPSVSSGECRLDPLPGTYRWNVEWDRFTTAHISMAITREDGNAVVYGTLTCDVYAGQPYRSVVPSVTGCEARRGMTQAPSASGVTGYLDVPPGGRITLHVSSPWFPCPDGVCDPFTMPAPVRTGSLQVNILSWVV